MLQPNPWLMGMELAWFKSKLFVVFAGRSVRNATEFQRCRGCCVYSVWIGDYRRKNLFFFKINCFLVPEPNCSPRYLWQNRMSVPQQSSASVGVSGQVWPAGRPTTSGMWPPPPTCRPLRMEVGTSRAGSDGCGQGLSRVG